MTVDPEEVSAQGLGSGAPLLVPGKSKCSEWVPGAEIPDWWGQSGASCGGLVAQKVDGDTVTYVPVLCKQWVCDVCSFYRQAWLTRNLVAFAEAARFPVMWTLTLKTGTRTRDESFLEIKAAWSKLRMRLGRKYGSLSFVWVVETTQAGYAHLHVIVDGYLYQPFVQAAWLAVTGDSMQVRFDKPRSRGRVARYIAKYVGKEVRERRWQGGAISGYHLFGKSQDVKFDAFTGEGDGWTVLAESWRENAEWVRRNCIVLQDAKWGPGRLVVRSEAGIAKLKAWEGPRALPPRVWDGPVKPWDRDELPAIPVAEKTMSAGTRSLVDRINAQGRGDAVLPEPVKNSPEWQAARDRLYEGPNRSGFGLKMSAEARGEAMIEGASAYDPERLSAEDRASTPRTIVPWRREGSWVDNGREWDFWPFVDPDRVR
jgi:hypothetical protein